MFITIIFVTLAALLFVHQQVEIAKLGYEIDRQAFCIEETLDHNQALLYNVVSLETPQNLKHNLFLADEKDFSFLNSNETIILAKEGSSPTVSADFINPRLFSRFLELISLTSEAQAKETK